jgi:subtilisin-like proprotein convertase family protein
MLALAGMAAGGAALAPVAMSKERMYERMLDLAQAMNGLKPRIGGDARAARRYEDLAAQYALLSAALGGDDPANAHSKQNGPVPAGGAAAGTIPPAPAGCEPVTATYTNATPVTIPLTPALVSSTITVAGAPLSLWDLNLQTAITHTFNGDLDITLTSPLGTIVTVTTDNGGGADNVFNGTSWDDDANPLGQVPYTSNDGLVTDAAYANGVVETPLVPEEAFGAFIGEDPNGLWTLTISDDAQGDGGSLASWSLEITALDQAPTGSAISVTNDTPLAIPTGPAVVTSVITVSGAASVICDLDVTTFLTHTANGDLDVTLASPAGTVVTITTDNGLGSDNVFNGTQWNDAANPGVQVPYTNNPGLVTDAAYASNVTQTPLVVEEALAAFNGENPNGEWLLTISDDALGDGGSLDSWTLDVVTCTCPPPPAGQVHLFLEPASFEAALAQTGKQLKASWDFKPHDVPTGSAVGLIPPLDIDTHGDNLNDPWTTNEGANLWPPFVDNVQFTSNLTPQGPLTPGDGGSIAFATAGSFPDVQSNILGENTGSGSFDIVSGPPAGDSHTAIAFEVQGVTPAPAGIQFTVTVYDPQDVAIATFEFPGTAGQTQFVGLLRKDREAIGRVDIWDVNGSFEGISSIGLYENAPACPWDCGAVPNGIVDVVDFLKLLKQWGQAGTSCDFDGNGINTVDFLALLQHWGPCP